MDEILNGFSFVSQDGQNRLMDRNGPYVNIISGYRVTTDQPEDYDGYIYFFGQSIIYGLGNEDKDTIPSCLQRQLNSYCAKNGLKPKRVINAANFYWQFYYQAYKFANSMHFTAKDILVFAFENHTFPAWTCTMYKGITCNTQKLFDRPHNMGEVFIDRTHVNRYGNKAIAKSLLKTISAKKLLYSDIGTDGSRESEDTAQELSVAFDAEDNTVKSPELQSFIDSITPLRHDTGTSGAIVMNCNPFTYGHRHLAEFAASRVDRLYIFVVEEDRSFFKFHDRIQLVKEGTADISNITVLPSGNFIISASTFGDYFGKEEKKDIIIDASNDVTIFGRDIAPALNITVRFAGEEPLDFITQQYNATMHDILPKYGVQFKVIARKECDGAPISASRVRELLKSKDFVAIAEIVPPTTLRFLRENYS
jgi:[citrate (pro-3S)-lyase] ligase